MVRVFGLLPSAFASTGDRCLGAFAAIRRRSTSHVGLTVKSMSRYCWRRDRASGA